jgi:hypothetical protein
MMLLLSKSFKAKTAAVDVAALTLSLSLLPKAETIEDARSAGCRRNAVSVDAKVHCRHQTKVASR